MMKTIGNPGCNLKAVAARMNDNYRVKTYILIMIVFSLFSCSSLPFAKNKTESEAGNTRKTDDAQKTKKTDKGERVVESVPQPGDIKAIDGVEYIYVSNRKYMFTAYEPEYIWERKDQYVPRMGQDLLADRESEKQRKALESRISKLEEDLKKKGIAPQIAYPAQMTSLPSPLTGNMSPVMPSSSFPSPKMRRRVIVLPIADETHYKKEYFGELASKKLISRLENTNNIICIDPNTLNLKGQLTDPANMTLLNEVYGVQAVLKGTISDAVTGSSPAAFNMSLFVYDTETGAVLRQFSGRSPASFSKENGGSALEEAKIKSIDASIELIAADIIKNLLTIEWHARIASIENGKVYINAGRLSGIEDGAALEVYSPGVQVFDSKTKAPLGKMKGSYKGKLKVSDLFGVDASRAQTVSGGNFSVSDLVYVKKD
jgi:hypothetical protein